MAKKELFDGIVVPIDWDSDDFPKTIALLLEDGEEIPVVMDAVGQDLLESIDEDVQVEGELIEDDNQGKVLKVSKFEVFEMDMDDEEYDDDEDEDE